MSPPKHNKGNSSSTTANLVNQMDPKNKATLRSASPTKAQEKRGSVDSLTREGLSDDNAGTQKSLA